MAKEKLQTHILDGISSMNLLEPFQHNERIAYFSMEIALQSDIPTYAGGLGVLAGDTLRTSADLELPMVAVTLISRMGYFKQAIDSSGQQTESPAPWQPEKHAQPLMAKVAVTIDGRNVWLHSWLYTIASATGFKVPVLLLDTDLTENTPQDRELTHYLYGRDEEYRLKQEIVLGIGGVRMLQALGFRVHTYHMNEGHSALLALELLRRYERQAEQVGPRESIYDATRVKEYCLFTTHTPVEAGHDQFEYSLVDRVLDAFVEKEELRLLAGQERLNMTRLALNLSGYVNGVAKSHAQISRSMFPGFKVRAINNGVHPMTWAAPATTKMYDRYIPNWCLEPENLIRADQIPDEIVLAAHKENKQSLIKKVNELTGVQLNDDIPILGFARRMTAYKRPDLLFTDLERLMAIAREQPFQIVMAGKAHPSDVQGKQLIATLHKHIRQLHDHIKMVFLPDYTMEQARYLVAGSDVWLNTPLRPYEASGTSGMKAALNGVPSLSVLDGWWVEGCLEGITGWAVGSAAAEANGHDAIALYEKLAGTVLPLYYHDHNAWVQVMKGAIIKNGSYFNSHRMMRRYAASAYLR
jgi:starch phosphorylase